VSKTEAVYACSVVPALTKGLRVLVKTLFKKDVVMVGEDVTIPLINRYRIPTKWVMTGLSTLMPGSRSTVLV